MVAYVCTRNMPSRVVMQVFRKQLADAEVNWKGFSVNISRVCGVS